MPFNLSGSDITSSFAQISNFSGWANFPTASSFGNNSFGQLGVTTVTTNVSSPVVIGSISTVYNRWIGATYLRSGTGLALINQNNQSFFAGQPQSDTATRRTPVQVGTLSGWSSIVNGIDSTIALRNNGTLWYWGQNNSGQLGNNSTGIRSSPVQVGALSVWTQITSGASTTYGVQNNGSLWSWGSNNYGQLGNNSTGNRSSPVQVGSIGGIWKVISGSTNTVLGVQSNGTLWAWGNNSFGQFGDFTVTHQSSPVQIQANGPTIANNWINVASSQTHTLGIQSNGTLWAWGSNSYGQLGINAAGFAYFTPTQVGAVSSWAQISTGNQASIAIQSDGTLWTWGSNSNGQLGLGDTTDRSSPTQINSTTQWSSIINGALDGFFMAAIQSNGTLWAWGSNSYGQLGTSNQTNYSSPVQVGTLSTWTAVSAGEFFMVGLQNNGTIWAWGNNSFGQLGTQNFNHRSSPVQIAPYNVSSWNSIYACGYSVLATQSNGSVWSWGTNSYGQLGTSNRVNYYSPIQISSFGASGWQKVNGATWSGAIVQSNGSLWTFGLNSWGQLGTGNITSLSTPQQIGSRPWSRIAITELNYHFLAVQNDNSLWAWGNNSFGQLGVGSAGTNIISPVQVGVTYNSSWSELYLGQFNSFGIQSPGTLWAWGSNSWGQLGNNSFGTNVVSPIQVGAESYWANVACGYFYAVAIQSNGTLWAWGNNSFGQLGQNDQTHRSSPVQVGTLSNWSQLDTSGVFILATQSNGTLWAWGQNSNFQLGLNDTVNRSSPAQVGSLSSWAQIASGQSYSTSIQSNGTLWAWGNNNSGQLGLVNPAGFPSSLLAVQYLNNTFGGFREVTASATQAYYQTVNDTILQLSTADIPTIDPTNTISWNSYDTGQNHFVGIKDDGTAWSIGNNSYGQLGYSTLTTSFFTAPRVSAGFQSTFAITSLGTLWAWGNNSWGQLGVNNQANYSSPVQVGTNSNWATISSSDSPASSSIGIQNDGTLWAWGNNTFGQLGLNTATVTYLNPVQVGVLSNWAQSTCGYYFVGAIQSNGTLWAWGNNSWGQLGQNNQTNYSSPVQVGAESVWSQVSAGLYHTLAIQNNGTLWAYGLNNSGRLGLGDTTSRSSPVQVGVESYWAQIRTGGAYSIGIQSNGTLWAWGGNFSGQLGLNTTTSYSSPVQVGAQSVWSQASCGYAHTVAIQSNGTLWAWGANSFGQLGMNNTGNFSSPIQIGRNSNWAQVSCGYFYTAAGQSNGTLWAWGLNSFGQLGNNSTTASITSPVQAGTLVSGSSTITTLTQIGSGTNWSSAIAADYGSMLIDNSNNAWVFGNNNQYQLGLSDTTNRSSPVQIIGPTKVINAAMDNNNICLIDANNNLWMGGNGNSNNFNGELSIANVSTPIQVGNLLNEWAQVSAGYTFGVALKTNGTLWSWGYNAQGQLGLSDVIFRSSPVQIGNASYWTQVSCGLGHVLALQNNGTLWAWGLGSSGQLGNNAITNQLSPIQIGTFSTWSKISAGWNCSAALQSNGTLWSWGQNNFGQLGLSNITTRSSPVQVGTLSTWTQIASAESNMSAIQSNGTLWMWGNNSFGQLGVGSAGTNIISPVQVGTLSSWSQIRCGYSARALQSNGTLWTWGNNSWGQLGQNNQTNYSSPVQVGAESYWSQISTASAPGYSVSIIQSNGTLWSLGNNSWGQLGTSNQTHYSSPVQVGTVSTWTQVALGGQSTNVFFTSAIQSNGSLWTWGSNGTPASMGGAGLGQLGRMTNYFYLAQKTTNNYWASVKTNQNTTLLIATNNTFWTYGSNTFGQLGSAPSTAYQFVLTQINALNTGTKIETKAGSSTIFAL